MNEDAKLLKEIYSKTNLSSKTLGVLLAHTENKTLRKELISQICEYDKINKEAGEEICKLGKKPKANKIVKSKLQLWGTGMSCQANPSISHIAETVSTFTSIGTINMTRTMNSCINAKPTVYNLGRKLINSDENIVKKMKPFL